MNIRDFILTAPREDAHAITCLLNQTHDHAGNGPNLQRTLFGTLRVTPDALVDLREDALRAWDTRLTIEAALKEHSIVVHNGR